MSTDESTLCETLGICVVSGHTTSNHSSGADVVRALLMLLVCARRFKILRAEQPQRQEGTGKASFFAVPIESSGNRLQPATLMSKEFFKKKLLVSECGALTLTTSDIQSQLLRMSVMENSTESMPRVEPIVSKIAHKIYSTECSVVDLFELEDYCMKNNLDYDATFLAECRQELTELRSDGFWLIDQEGDLRSLSVTLHRVLGVAKCIFAEKLADVAEAFVEVVGVVSKRGIRNVSIDSSATVEYALKTMHLMMQQVLDETIGHLECAL